MKKVLIAMVLIAVMAGTAFGAGFDLKNVSWSESGEWTKIIGQIVNNSKDYGVIYFRINVYEAYGNKLLASELTGFQDFRKGTTRTFSESFKGTFSGSIRVEIEFSSGS